MMGSMRPSSLSAAGLALVLVMRRARGQSPQDFYKGKQLHADRRLRGRQRLRHRRAPAGANTCTRHIPGQPTIIVQNMPQAAGVVAANYLYVRAPRDGTVLGLDLAQFAEPGGHGAAQHRG